MSLGDGLAISGGYVLVAGLSAFQRAVFDSEGGNDLVPDLGGLTTFEIIGKQQLFLHRDRLGRNLGQVGGDGGCGDENDRREEACDHGGWGNGCGL
jgi:hypothetical protein